MTHGNPTERLTRLVVWTAIGLAGCGFVIGGGLTDDWITYLVGLVWTVASIFMLGSGLWLRWPRG